MEGVIVAKAGEINAENTATSTPVRRQSIDNRKDQTEGGRNG